MEDIINELLEKEIFVQKKINEKRESIYFKF